MAQSGSASALGAEGRGFKSLCPDILFRVRSDHWRIIHRLRAVQGHSPARRQPGVLGVATEHLDRVLEPCFEHEQLST